MVLEVESDTLDRNESLQQPFNLSEISKLDRQPRQA